MRNGRGCGRKRPSCTGTCCVVTSSRFDARPLAEIREPHVRRWRKDLLDAGVSAVTVAKAYRLLKAIFNTAVDDGLIRRNPCRIKGAGQEKSAGAAGPHGGPGLRPSRCRR